MAEFRTLFFRSFLVNQPDLVRRVLKERPEDFPKSDRIAEGLKPLLGEKSVFLTNGAEWKQQRRIIDPAFEGGRLRDVFPAMCAAAASMSARLERSEGAIDVEREASYVAADVIFRTLFSIPIEHDIAKAVFREFQTYQRTQPIVNIAALIPLPAWVPRLFRKSTRGAARRLRGLIADLVAQRAKEIDLGIAPQDLATKIMTQQDPETGKRFTRDEMVDQVAIFFLAGHETSASALSWALYLLATHPDLQDQVAAEAKAVDFSHFSEISRLKLTRDVFRETLRLYPPVPMMVREATCPERFRDRDVPRGAQIVISPWHLHRHSRLWDNPDGFDPMRWETDNGKSCMRNAFFPFSAGARVCTGAGFAMAEGVILLAQIMKSFHVEAFDNDVPVPVAHLTVRSKSGIRLRFVRR
ncbi:MAG: cytochrome P450 [Paracoccaceae bacterium]